MLILGLIAGILITYLFYVIVNNKKDMNTDDIFLSAITAPIKKIKEDIKLKEEAEQRIREAELILEQRRIEFEKRQKAIESIKFTQDYKKLIKECNDEIEKETLRLQNIKQKELKEIDDKRNNNLKTKETSKFEVSKKMKELSDKKSKDRTSVSTEKDKKLIELQKQREKINQEYYSLMSNIDKEYETNRNIQYKRNIEIDSIFGKVSNELYKEKENVQRLYSKELENIKSALVSKRNDLKNKMNIEIEEQLPKILEELENKTQEKEVIV